MKISFRYSLLLALISVLLFYFLIPEKQDFTKTFYLTGIIFIFSYFLLSYLLSKKRNNYKINLGIIFYCVMILILIIGNSSTYAIKFIFPNYDDNLITTNIYWLTGILFFSLGYLFSNNKSNRVKYFYPLNNTIIILLFFVTLLGTLVAYYFIGFIPFLQGAGTGERFDSYGTSSLFNRMWSLCVVVAVLSFLSLKINKNFIMFIVLVLSILISFFFIVRMYPFLIFVVIFLIWNSLELNKIKILIISLIFVIVFFAGNTLFQNYRTGESVSPLQSSGQLNYVQSKIIYDSFNEFGQLKRAINEYKAEPQYGLTFISIPLGFIPAWLLEPFGIIKSKLQQNNSAILMARWIGSESSTGIRIGILGEFFINFGFLGSVFMIFIGIAVKYIQDKINILNPWDWRYAFYMIFYAILLYSLIGQIDAIGSLIGNYVLLFIVLKIFTLKINISNE